MAGEQGGKGQEQLVASCRATLHACLRTATLRNDFEGQAVLINSEVNISSYPAIRVPGLFLHSRAVIFKSGCFVQKYWSGTVTRKTVIQRADDS